MYYGGHKTSPGIGGLLFGRGVRRVGVVRPAVSTAMPLIGLVLRRLTAT